MERPEATPVVLRAVERGLGGRCSGCEREVCGHDVVMSFVLGFKDAVRCLPCLARGLGRELAAVRATLLDHIAHRDCWSAGWRRASELEHGTSCTTASGAALAADDRSNHAPTDAPRAEAPRRADAEWDAGDMGCGDLVLELRQRLTALRPGQVLKLSARDPGAPADLPAWCGLTGHALLEARHPTYWIRRKES